MIHNSKDDISARLYYLNELFTFAEINILKLNLE